ncbi:MAG TPA: hypothetical protein VH088_14825 [Terriglobales bacterium]|nr:hypothetical protein [Terriglobales bacterium]
MSHLSHSPLATARARDFDHRALAALNFPSQPRGGKLKFFLAAILALSVASELFCRFIVGLGDPPLYQADPTMEYMLQPGKTYHRFHHRFSVNAYGMRADDFPLHKSSPEELRVLIVGDSVVYGGVRIDQRLIDTEILKRNLQRQYHRPVVIGNASAKSWGPPNELAYLKRFGTFDADVVILALSSHDYADAPTFIPVVGISGDYPGKRPWFAITDLLRTYILPTYFHWGVTPPEVDRTNITIAESERDIAVCREAERALFTFVREHNAKVALVQHLSLPEVKGTGQPGYFANQAVAQAEQVPFTDDAGDLRAQLKAGKNPFFKGDPLHLNGLGQIVLARTLQRAVVQALQSN